MNFSISVLFYSFIESAKNIFNINSLKIRKDRLQYTNKKFGNTAPCHQGLGQWGVNFWKDVFGNANYLTKTWGIQITIIAFEKTSYYLL